MAGLIEVICVDMAGTTMSDDGVVVGAFRRTIATLGLDRASAARAESYVKATMGQSKIEVFRALFGPSAERANGVFESAIADVARELGVSALPGVEETVTRWRAGGRRVALTTGFSPQTREALVDLLGWGDLFDLRVSPADAGRGRPSPDMVWWSAARLEAPSCGAIMVVGDTAADIESGKRAGAGRCVGVRTGSDDEAALLGAGADAVVDSLADLADLE